jgi:5-methyltetrahydropteroyltriglutamate--homocysteine methyltransferase
MRTTVIGSYPFPAWLQHAAANLGDFGPDDVAELQEDAVIAAVHDQVVAGLDAISDGEQTRLDFNLSFYGYLEGIALEGAPARRWGPPAHDQRGRHTITGELSAPRGLGVLDEWRRLQELAPPGPRLKASVPGPYTLSGRIEPNADYADRWAVAEGLLPIVQAELVALVKAGSPSTSPR